MRTILFMLLALVSLRCAQQEESAAPPPPPSSPAVVGEMTVKEFDALRQQGSAPFLLDVRNPEEVEIASMGADLLIPLGELPARMGELAAYRDQPIVVHCRTGRRSAQAAQELVDAGFTHVINLKGGIQAWSQEIDPTVPQY
ncbi:MAG: rhodanese-like domain-containing protein [Rhodothermales bacterium]